MNFMNPLVWQDIRPLLCTDIFNKTKTSIAARKPTKYLITVNQASLYWLTILAVTIWRNIKLRCKHVSIWNTNYNSSQICFQYTVRICCYKLIVCLNKLAIYFFSAVVSTFCFILVFCHTCCDIHCSIRPVTFQTAITILLFQYCLSKFFCIFFTSVV